MSALLSPTDRERIIACLHLWERPGTAAERDAAAAGAIRILRARGLGWADIFAPAWPAPSEREHGETDLAVSLRALATLTNWEKQFVISLRGSRRFSPKQSLVLAGIARRVRSAA